MVRAATSKVLFQFSQVPTQEFRDCDYLAGVDFTDNGIEEQARSIEKSYQMLKLLENSVNIMRNKHKHGETYYWLLYYSYLSPQQYRKIKIMDDKGNESSMLLGKQSKVKIGYRYRFYFKETQHISLGSEYLDSAMSSDSFLGYEELGEYAADTTE